MRKCKKTKSAVLGQIPARLRQEFNLELATPASIIFNIIAPTAKWPNSIGRKPGNAVFQEQQVNYLPEFQLASNQIIEVVEEMKIVGFVLRYDRQKSTFTIFTRIANNMKGCITIFPSTTTIEFLIAVDTDC